MKVWYEKDYRTINKKGIDKAQVLKRQVNIESIIDIIKTCKFKSLIDKIKKEKNKAVKSKLKWKLPPFIMAEQEDGIRRKPFFIKSQFLAMDIDILQPLDYGRHLFDSNPYTLISFVSPSQKGFKVIFKLEEPIDDYDKYKAVYSYYYEKTKEYLEAFKEKGEIKSFKIDATIDPARFIYVSCDPDIYYNPKCITKRIPTLEELEPYTKKYKKDKYANGSGEAIELTNSVFNFIVNATEKVKKKKLLLNSEHAYNWTIKAAGIANSYGVNESDFVKEFSRYAESKNVPYPIDMLIHLGVESIYDTYPEQFGQYLFKEKKGNYFFNDICNGDLLANALYNTVKWVNDRGVWCIWNSDENIWEFKEDGLIFGRILPDLVRENIGDVDPKEFAQIVKKSHDVKYLTNAIKIMRTDKRLIVDSDFFDNKDNEIIVKNGVINFTGDPYDFKPFTGKPIHRSTKRMNVFYDENAKAPIFNNFLNETFGNEGIIEFVQTFFGYTLTGDISERKFLMFIGEGANGKSTLINIIDFVMGDYSDKVSNKTFIKTRNDINETLMMRLKGLRLAYSSESNKRDVIDSGKVKDFTGGEKLIGKNLYENPISFKPKAKLVISTNDEPIFDGNDQALMDRMFYLRFNNMRPKDQQDHKLLSKLETEASGVLNWMLEGYSYYLATGFKHVPADMAIAVNELKEDSNIYLQFINECMIEDEGYQERSRLTYYAFKEWMHTIGYVRSPTETMFGREIKKIIKKTRTNKGVVFVGYKLNTKWRDKAETTKISIEGNENPSFDSDF